MSNMSEDIQYAGSDTRPPMLDRTDFDSWQQRIRLYCLGKDNGENIMKSITEGPFQMGMVIQTVAEETEGAPQLGPERARVFTDLTAKEKERFERVLNFDQLYAYLKQNEVHLNEKQIDDGKVHLPIMSLALGLMRRFSSIQHSHPCLNPQINHLSADNFQLDSGSSSTENLIEMEIAGAGNAGGQNRVGNVNPGQAKPIKCYNCNGLGHIAREFLDEEQLLFLTGEQVTNFDDDVDDPPEQDLALNVDHVFEADQLDAFDSML
ncbi:retrovirus-related pol polyprotein from transposon TNT 1-94 [Tanacetum coccineum]